MKDKPLVLSFTTICLALLFLAFPVHAEKQAQAPEKMTPHQCPHAQSMQQGQGGAVSDQGWRCPMGGASRGPGGCPAMGTQHPGYHGGWYMAPSRQRGGTEYYKTPLTKEQAKNVMENYLRETNNPNLKVGKITEEEDYFVARLETKDGSLVDEIQIHKMTGWIRSAYNIPPEKPAKDGAQ